jgi:hypothetical protein
MSNCTFCGAVEYWHAVEEGAEFTPYCPNCHPPETVVLPLDVGKDWDIDESEIPGMPAPVQGSPSLTGHHLNNSNPPVHAINGNPAPGFAVGGAHSLDIQDEGDATLVMNGEQVLATYDEWPENAEQGTLGFKKGVSGAHVFDGEEWQNLGEALLNKKRNVITPRDEKINRRGAVAHTKSKEKE